MKPKQFLEMLTLYSYNMKVIHWNSIGPSFDDIHDLADKYYAKINTTIDTIGEIIGMMDGDIPSFKDLVEDLKDSEKDFLVVDATKKYTFEGGVALIEVMLEDIVVGVNKMLKEFDDDDSSLIGIISELENVQFMYSKEAKYFNKRRR